MFGKKPQPKPYLPGDEGRPATATVLSCRQASRQTLGRSDGRADLGLTQDMKIRVEPPGEEPFEAKLIVKSTHETGRRRPLRPVDPGESIAVRYDPDDHRRVSIDSTDGSQQGAAAEWALNRLTASGRLSDEQAKLAGANLMGGSAADGQRAKAIFTPGQLQSAFGHTEESDPVDMLAKLADLRDRGALTPEEFEEQKKRILGT